MPHDSGISPLRLTGLVGDLENEVRQVCSVHIARSPGQRQIGRDASGRNANIGGIVARASSQSISGSSIAVEDGGGRGEPRKEGGLPVNHHGEGDDGERDDQSRAVSRHGGGDAGDAIYIYTWICLDRIPGRERGQDSVECRTRTMSLLPLSDQMLLPTRKLSSSAVECNMAWQIQAAAILHSASSRAVANSRQGSGGYKRAR